MKPPFAYFGGKMSLADRIVAALPEHRVYIEPFFGSGAVLFAKTPSRFEVVNDLDGAVVNFFRVLRDRCDDLEVACRLTPHARDEFERADLDTEADEVERARQFWVRTNQSVTKSPTGSGWATSLKRNGSMAATISSRIGRFAAVAERLSLVTIENRDAVSIIENVATANSVIYVDPPYLATTRVGSDHQGRDYRCDTSTTEDHERLAAALLATPAKVVLSGYESPLYGALFAGWDKETISVASHGGRTEVLWFNYDRSPGSLDFGATA